MSDMYERRFRATAVAERVMIGVPFFRDLTEREKSKISNRSVKMFTLSGIRSATESLLMGLQLESDERRIELASGFWTEVGENIREWRMVKDGDVSAADLRRDYIHAHTLALAAIARAGNQILREKPGRWRSTVKKLRIIDWRRSNAALWEGRAMNAGRLSKHSVNVTLTANAVKRHLGLRLSPDEERLESEFARRTK
jgi:DNA sulfur modification protein DndB